EHLDLLDGREREPGRRGGQLPPVPLGRRRRRAARPLGVHADLHVAPARGGVELGGVGLELDVAVGLAERLDLRGGGLAQLVELVGLAGADLTDGLVAGGPAAKAVQERAGVAERLGDAGQGDHLLGALGQAADQAEAVIDGVGACAAVGAEEVGAAEADGSDGGQGLAGAGALVAAGLAAGTGAGGGPLFSASSACCCKVAARQSRRNCRPCPSRRPSQASSTVPRGACRACCSSWAASSTAIWTI